VTSPGAPGSRNKQPKAPKKLTLPVLANGTLDTQALEKWSRRQLLRVLRVDKVALSNPNPLSLSAPDLRQTALLQGYLQDLEQGRVTHPNITPAQATQILAGKTTQAVFQVAQHQAQPFPSPFQFPAWNADLSNLGDDHFGNPDGVPDGQLKGFEPFGQWHPPAPRPTFDTTTSTTTKPPLALPPYDPSKPSWPEQTTPTKPGETIVRSADGTIIHVNTQTMKINNGWTDKTARAYAGVIGEQLRDTSTPLEPVALQVLTTNLEKLRRIVATQKSEGGVGVPKARIILNQLERGNIPQMLADYQARGAATPQNTTADSPPSTTSSNTNNVLTPTQASLLAIRNRIEAGLDALEAPTRRGLRDYVATTIGDLRKNPPAIDPTVRDLLLPVLEDVERHFRRTSNDISKQWKESTRQSLAALQEMVA
jgi:hypothetical protein